MQNKLIQLGSVHKAPIPREKNITFKFSEKAIKELNSIITHYPNKKAAMLPALWMAQREYGGVITGEAIMEVAHYLGRSAAEVEGVATFYSMYNVGHAVGKHKIEVCTCLTCQVCDGYQILDYLQKKLNIKTGETTADGLFTLEEVECLNACDRAPLLQVGDQYHGPMTPETIDELLQFLKQKQESTVVQMADEIVKAHLSEKERS